MVIQWIDWDNPGTYKSGWYDGKASRKECGRYAYFQFTSVSSSRWTVRRYGSPSHSVCVCRLRYHVVAECDCYDFQEYGEEFKRACIHIWAVYLRKPIVGC